MILVHNSKSGTWSLAEEVNGELIRVTLDTDDREGLLSAHKMPLNSGYLDIIKLRRRVEDRLRKADLATVIAAARATGTPIVLEP